MDASSAIAGYNYDGLDTFAVLAGMMFVLVLGTVLAIGLAVMRSSREPRPAIGVAVLVGYLYAAILVGVTASIHVIARREGLFFAIMGAGAVAYWLVVWRMWSRQSLDETLRRH